MDPPRAAPGAQRVRRLDRRTRRRAEGTPAGRRLRRPPVLSGDVDPSRARHPGLPLALPDRSADPRRGGALPSGRRRGGLPGRRGRPSRAAAPARPGGPWIRRARGPRIAPDRSAVGDGTGLRRRRRPPRLHARRPGLHPRLHARRRRPGDGRLGGSRVRGGGCGLRIGGRRARGARDGLRRRGRRAPAGGQDGRGGGRGAWSGRRGARRAGRRTRLALRSRRRGAKPGIRLGVRTRTRGGGGVGQLSRCARGRGGALRRPAGRPFAARWTGRKRQRPVIARRSGARR